MLATVVKNNSKQFNHTLKITEIYGPESHQNETEEYSILRVFNVVWQSATTVHMGCFAGCTRTISDEWYTVRSNSLRTDFLTLILLTWRIW